MSGRSELTIAQQMAAEAAAARGVRWWQWRAISDPRVPDGLADVRYRWRFVDLLEAHWALDVYDALKPARKPG